jgi:galactokinase
MADMIDFHALREQFRERFGAAPAAVARAPGRVNLIGEHTDYNDGFVLPIAIEESTWALAAERKDGLARVYSANLDETREWPIDAWPRAELPHWTSYVAGIAAMLRRRKARLAGFDLLIASDVPVGGGLSSSAALSVSTLMSLGFLAGEPLETSEFVDLCRQAEHEFAGVPCGLMDPSASLLAKAGHALLLDCRTRKNEHVPLELGDARLFVIDSGVRHELAAGEYAKRQKECQTAVAYFKRVNPAVRALRDVSSDTVRSHALQMDPLAASRALHVTSENERVQAAVLALKRRKLDVFGALMRESHVSLRDQYQVSCRELDELFDLLRKLPGVLGVRMTGGGFGGCVLVLAKESAIAAITERVEREYSAGRDESARIFPVSPGAGAEVVRA